MSKPLTKKQSFAVQTFMLGIAIALALITYGVLYPVMNEGLRTSAAVGIGAFAIAGSIAINYYNDD